MTQLTERERRWLDTLLVISTLVAAIVLIGQVSSLLLYFSDILLVFFLAWLLAFVINPIASLMRTIRLVPTIAKTRGRTAFTASRVSERRSMYASATMRVHTATISAVDSTLTSATTTSAASWTANELESYCGVTDPVTPSVKRSGWAESNTNALRTWTGTTIAAATTASFVNRDRYSETAESSISPIPRARSSGTMGPR